jgi:hypothetical protein
MALPIIIIKIYYTCIDDYSNICWMHVTLFAECTNSLQRPKSNACWISNFNLPERKQYYNLSHEGRTMRSHQIEVTAIWWLMIKTIGCERVESLYSMRYKETWHLKLLEVCTWSETRCFVSEMWRLHTRIRHSNLNVVSTTILWKYRSSSNYRS